MTTLVQLSVFCLGVIPSLNFFGFFFDILGSGFASSNPLLICWGVAAGVGWLTTTVATFALPDIRGKWRPPLIALVTAGMAAMVPVFPTAQSQVSFIIAIGTMVAGLSLIAALLFLPSPHSSHKP